MSLQDRENTDWDAELMREVQRDPDVLEQIGTPARVHGAFRWTVLAVLALLVTACCCALSLVAGV